MSTRTHNHPCLHAPRCTNVVPCNGEWVRNHDGIPDVICDQYHNPDGSLDAMPCEACQDAECVQCGSVTRVEAHDVSCPQHQEYVETNA